MKRILILIPYFGRWPQWIHLFMESCRFNPTVNWHFFTDCDPPENRPDNVAFTSISFSDYCDLLNECLGVQMKPDSPYKICDMRPMFGIVHADILKGFDYWGFGDVDVIYGDIRHFYTEQVLTHNIVSSRDLRISGHLCLLKNNQLMCNAFRRIDNWKHLIEQPHHMSLDESRFSKVFIRHRKHPRWLRRLYGLWDPYHRNSFFRDQYTTPLSVRPWWNGSHDHPMEWYWRQGRLTNCQDGDRPFLYLHFMHYKSSRWLDKKVRDRAPWEDLDELVHFDYRDAPNGWMINEQGFSKIQ